jgi:hypothetical protein
MALALTSVVERDNHLRFCALPHAILIQSCGTDGMAPPNSRVPLLCDLCSAYHRPPSWSEALGHSAPPTRNLRFSAPAFASIALLSQRDS